MLSMRGKLRRGPTYIALSYSSTLTIRHTCLRMQYAGTRPSESLLPPALAARCPRNTPAARRCGLLTRTYLLPGIALQALYVAATIERGSTNLLGISHLLLAYQSRSDRGPIGIDGRKAIESENPLPPTRGMSHGSRDRVLCLAPRRLQCHT